MGAAVAWRRSDGWGGQSTYLGKNKELFDAEVYAILQAVKIMNARGEGNQSYTIFSDSQAAIARVRYDDCRPAQALARAVVDFSCELHQRGNSITIRWAPSREGVEGNEQADTLAKRAAEGKGNRASPKYLREASLSHLTRKSTEARTKAAGDWIQDHVCRERRYRPTPRGKLRKGLGKVRKELAGRFYQLLSGHAAIGPHLKRVSQARCDKCWWYISGEFQTRHHHFIRCWCWMPEIRQLWQRVESDCEWIPRRAPTVRLLFRDERATQAVLEFLEKARVGRMPGLALLGVEEEEEDLEEIGMWLDEGDEPGSEGGEGGPGPP